MEMICWHNIGGNRAGGTATIAMRNFWSLMSGSWMLRSVALENWMCSQVLFTGKVLCLDGDTQNPVAEIDYGPISRTVTAKPWSDPTSDPLVDLKSAQRLVSGACGFTANLIVMGRDAGDSFESHAKVMESYNKLAIQSGTLSPDYEQFGIVLLGTCTRIPLYVSEEQYEDVDGTMKYYVPPKEVLVAATGVRVMAYAGIAQVNEDGAGMQVYAVGASRSSTGTRVEKTIVVSGFPAGRFRFPETPTHGLSCRFSLNN